MNKRLILVLAAAIMIGFSLNAEPWKVSSDINVSVNQSNYSDNWAGSEVSALSWTATSNSSIEKQLSRMLNSKTTLKLSFGQTHQQALNSIGEKYWIKPVKSSDKIDLESVLKIDIGFYLDPFASARWESQFLDQSDPQSTITFNPSLFTEAVGVSRTFIKNESDNLSARLGAAFRQFVNRDVYNNDTGSLETINTNDGGVELVGMYEKLMIKHDAKLNSKLVLYQALINSDSDNLNSDWKALDLTWENSISTQVWKAISLNLYVELKYEKEEDQDPQYKQTMGLGISYRLY